MKSEGAGATLLKEVATACSPTGIVLINLANTKCGEEGGTGECGKFPFRSTSIIRIPLEIDPNGVGLHGAQGGLGLKAPGFPGSDKVRICTLQGCMDSESI